MSFKILVPLDGTPQADRALLYSETLVRAIGGQLKLIRVGVSGSPTDYIDAAEAGIRAEFKPEGEARPRLRHLLTRVGDIS